jgi:hypothetical protein
MIPSGDIKIITYLRNALSVLILVLGLTWLWATWEQHWLKEYMEPSLVVVGVLISFCQFLIMRWSSGPTIEKNKFYNIPNTKQHREWLTQARASIADGMPDEALKTLSAIQVESVTTLVTLLSGRWAEYTRSHLAGILERTDRTFHQISKDVMGLIDALEAEMNTYGKVDKEVREYLQRRYTNRLQQKLANRQPINLRRLPTTEGTSEETAESFVTVSAEDVQVHIAKVFEAAYGRLLITGKPGAGKTVLLLQLELALLASENDLLPVILNLATWKKDYITLEPWLKELLPAELGATKKYAADILRQNRLILLFDGLDEVAGSDRAACLEAIGRYRAATNSPYVITSRIEEYRAISKDAPVNLQIEVGDLTLDQMEAELTRMGHQQAEAIPLLNALKRHPLLREAAQVPFYFNTLQLLFAGGKTLSDLDLKGHTAEAIQEELTPQFVSYALTLPPDKTYTPQQAARRLSFLADNMTRRKKVVFELTDLQYDWSPVALSRGQLMGANFVGGLVSGLGGGLVVGLGGGLVYGLFVGLREGLVLGLREGLVLGLVLGLVAGLFVVLREGLVLGLVLGIVLGIGEGLRDGLRDGLVLKKQPKLATREGIKWSWALYFRHAKEFLGVGGLGVSIVIGFGVYPEYGLVVSLVIGLVIGLVLGLVASLLDYLRDDSIASIQINHPYQRFKNSARMLYPSILQHRHLMYIFSRKGWLPWQIVPFLNDMVTQQVLECPDGATWRFRHRILQDHFAERWETTSGLIRMQP